MSGVHKDGKPTCMPEQLWSRAESRMAFFGVSGLRPRLGAELGRIFANDIPINTLTDAAAAFTRSLDQIRELIGGERASEVTSFEQCDLSSLQSALPEGAWITLPLDAAGLEATWRQALLSDSRDVSFIVDRTGQLIAGADSAEDRSPARSSVLELIRAYVALRHLAAERLHVELPHQRYCTIVKRRPSTALPALAFMEWNGESSRIESYTASLPPFYTEIIGVTVGPARGLRRFAAEKEYKRTATWP